MFLCESIYSMDIEKFLYLSSLGWLLQEYNFWMGRGFQVWKFHLKISPWEKKPSLPRAYGPWEASFSSLGLIFGGEEISIPETRPIRKSYIPVWVTISDDHWKIFIHFQKFREIVSCTSEKKSFLNCCYLTNFLAMWKSDFQMAHVEIIFKLLLFD